jgi:hypothetical protein
MAEQIIDQVPREQIATWEELTTNSVVLKRLPTGRIIKHLAFVPLDKLIGFQAVAGRKDGGMRDVMGYMTAILKYVMVDPPVTEETVRAMVKANGGLLLSIISAVTNTEEAKLIEDGLGEASPGSP